MLKLKCDVDQINTKKNTEPWYYYVLDNFFQPFHLLFLQYSVVLEGNPPVLSKINVKEWRGLSMPEEIINQITDMTSEMASAIFKSLLMYMIIPIFGVVIVSKFLLRITGKVLKAIVVITLFICLYFYGTEGLPKMLTEFNNYLEASK
jgi:hypothetical protein